MTSKQIQKAFSKEDSKEESMAFVTCFKSDKRDSSKWSKRRVDYYGNNVK